MSFISGFNGLWHPKLITEFTWNRFINLHGGDGNNIPTDLYNEFMNRDFKGIATTKLHKTLR